MKWLAGTFLVLAAAAFLAGARMTVSATDAGWVDVGRALMSLAIAFAVGGSAAVVVKVAEQGRADRAAWSELLKRVVEVDQTVRTGRVLIQAHKTAKTYNEQHAKLITAHLTLRQVQLDPLVANAKRPKRVAMFTSKLRALVWRSRKARGNASDIADHISSMAQDLLDLTSEYEDSYLRVARQQRIDELLLTTRASEIAGLKLATVVDDPIYMPTTAWLMMRELNHLKDFLDPEKFKSSAFVQAYGKVKPILEQQAGIRRTDPYGDSDPNPESPTSLDPPATRRPRCHTRAMPSENGRQVDVALAEFEALRAEMLIRRGAQKNLVAIALSAYGVLFTLALGRDGDQRLLLLVPPLGLTLCLLQLGESLHIHRIGRYIKGKLWPTLTDLTGYKYSWEREHSKRFGVTPWIGAVLTDAMIPLLLAGGAFAAVVPYAQAGGFEDDLEWLRIVEYLLIAATVAAAVVFAAYVAWTDRQDKGPADSATHGTTVDAKSSAIDTYVALDDSDPGTRTGRAEGGPPPA